MCLVATRYVNATVNFVGEKKKKKRHSSLLSKAAAL